jgi:hypothetical protein
MGKIVERSRQDVRGDHSSRRLLQLQCIIGPQLHAAAALSTLQRYIGVTNNILSQAQAQPQADTSTSTI